MLDVEQIAATVQQDAQVASGWAPVDLAETVRGVEAGEIVGPVPSLMPRSDGVALLYPGELHSLAGEPEGGKSWIAQHACVEELRAGNGVLFLDFEDGAASVVARLLALGATGEQIVSGFTYVKPDGPLDREAFAAVIARGHTLAVLDGMTEAYGLLGLDIASNADVPVFLQRLARPLARAGAAVLLLDHVAKNADNRGRFALGAGHKLAGVAVAYGVTVIEAPSRSTPGLVKVTVQKDRHGHVRGNAHGGTIALARIVPEEDGARVTVTLDAPDDTGAEGAFRPTVLMERVSRYVEANPGVTHNQIRKGVKGNNTAKDSGLALLISEKYLTVKADGQARRHHVAREYREANDTPTAPTVPNRAQTMPGARSAPTVPTVPPSYKEGHGHGHGSPTRQSDRAHAQPPDPDPHLAVTFDPWEPNE